MLHLTFHSKVAIALYLLLTDPPKISHIHIQINFIFIYVFSDLFLQHVAVIHLTIPAVGGNAIVFIIAICVSFCNTLL